MYRSVMIAGTGSGTGKTTITCAILGALMDRGMTVGSYKCGPDYIDPMFHREVIGAKAYNLDSYFLDDEMLQKHFSSHAKAVQMNVIESAMGFYDGVGYTTKGSAYEIATILDVPVVLVVNGKGMANSLVAMVKGYLEYQKDSHIKGVILNQVSERTYRAVKDEIEQLGVKMCGYIPRLKEDLIVKSRHLGLVQANEYEDVKMRLQQVKEVVMETLNLESILAVASEYDKSNVCDGQSLQHESIQVEESGWKKGLDGRRVRIALAKDEAFSFMYAENLDVLESLGCEVVPFSPIHDEELPKDVDGIFLMGGYPEIYASQLAKNERIKQEIITRFNTGMPVFAECGGYMYLKEELEDENGDFHKMVGILPGKCSNNHKLTRFGYVELTSKQESLLGPKGTKVRGHEFHYWDAKDNGDGFLVTNSKSPEGYPAVYVGENFYAGFPHIYFLSNREVVNCIVEKCLRYHNERVKNNGEE